MIDAEPSVAPTATPDKKKFTGDYREYLESPHWLNTATLRKIKSNYVCDACRTNKRLEVHHLHYNSLGNESMDDLMTLCHDCHKFAHKLFNRQPSHLPSEPIRIMTFHFIRNYSSNSRFRCRGRTFGIPASLCPSDATFLKSAIRRFAPDTVFSRKRSYQPLQIPMDDHDGKKPPSATPNMTVLREPSTRRKWSSKLTNRFK